MTLDDEEIRSNGEGYYFAREDKCPRVFDILRSKDKGSAKYFEGDKILPMLCRYLRGTRTPKNRRICIRAHFSDSREALSMIYSPPPRGALARRTECS